MEEIWKDIKGYEGIYQISNLGKIKSLDRYVKSSYGSVQFRKGKLKSLRVEKKTGYLMIDLNDENGKSTTWRLHQLLAINFLNHIPNGSKLVIDHIDNNPSNNSLDNLQITSSRNNTSKDKKDGYSKYTGVYFNNNRWHTSIRINGEKVFLGTYNNETEAGEIYQLALKNINLHFSNSKEDNKEFREKIKQIYNGS